MFGLGLTIPQIAVRRRGSTSVPAVGLSNTNINENASIGDTIGTLSVSNGSGAYTFSITSDLDAKFSLTGPDLKLAALLDYETKTSHNVTIQATGTGGPYTREFIIYVGDIFEDTTAPIITSSNSLNLAENTPLSHTLTANEAVTWTKTGGIDTALFTLAGNTLSLTAKDYEVPVDADVNNIYVVQVTATDAAAFVTNQTISVTITDVVEGGAYISALKFNDARNSMYLNT